MVENITIAAREFGFETRVDLLRDGDELPAAALLFQGADVPKDPLFPSIDQRCTNRRPYQTKPLVTGVLETISRAIPADGLSTLQFVQGAAERRIIARAASLNDRLLFEIRVLHDRFFDCMRWTADEAERTRDGLFVATLELGPAASGFRAMRSWRLARFVNAMGMSRFAPFHSFRTFMRSPAFGFLQMNQDSPDEFFEGGRRMERVWLTATSLGLSFQPMAGMLYLLPYLRSDEKSLVTGNQRSLLEKADRLFRQVLPLGDQKAPILLFRLGYGPPPSATSLRRKFQPDSKKDARVEPFVNRGQDFP
jgi:hypothetical protein